MRQKNTSPSTLQVHKLSGLGNVVCGIVREDQARVLEGVAKSQFPRKAAVFKMETVFKDGFEAIYPLHHSGVGGVNCVDFRTLCGASGSLARAENCGGVGGVHA